MAETFELIYMGRRYLQGGKIGHAFTRLQQWENSTGKTTHQLDREASVWPLKSTPSVIGGVYTVEGERSEDRFSIFPKTLKYQRRITHEFVDVWSAQDISLAAEQRRKNLEKRSAKDTRLNHLIEQLRVIYKKMPAADRLAFQMHIVFELTK